LIKRRGRDSSDTRFRRATQPRRFTEGFDTPDLKDAKALLDELT
jgi:hypothetical protein